MSNPSQAALDAVQHAVLARSISVRAALLAYHALGGDPSALEIPCEAEGCVSTMRQGESLSLIGLAHTIAGVALAMTGASHVQPTQCDAEQHYGCTLEHALAAHVRCLQDHVFPKHQAKVEDYLASKTRPLPVAPPATLDTPAAPAAPEGEAPYVSPQEPQPDTATN